MCVAKKVKEIKFVVRPLFSYFRVFVILLRVHAVMVKRDRSVDWNVGRRYYNNYPCSLNDVL